MKKTIAACLIFVIALPNLRAQDSVKHSLGGSIGIPGLRLGISYKVQFQNNFAILLDGGVGSMNVYLMTPCEIRHRTIDVCSCGVSLLSASISPIFLYNSLSGKHYDWYIGGGPSCGFTNILNAERSITVGGLLCVGFEWHFKEKQMDVDLDLRPSASCFIDHRNQYTPCGIFDMPLTVTIRKRF